jgi:hypothetical protein
VVFEVPKPSLSAGVHTAGAPGDPGAFEDEEAASARPVNARTNKLATRTAATTTTHGLSIPDLAMSSPYIPL